MAWNLLDSGTAVFADGSGGHSYSYPGGAPSAGNLLVLGVNSNTVVTTPSGWTLAISDVQNQGAYSFYRVAGAGEASSVTVTTSGDHNTALSFRRYSGQASSSPLDVTAKAAVINAGLAASPAVDPGALTGPGELALLWAMNHDPVSANAPTSPVPPSGYSNLADTGLQGGTGSGVQHFLVGRTDASGDPPSLSVEWSTVQFVNRTALFVSFKPAPSEIGVASETDTALALGVRKTAALGVASATETAQPLGKRKVLALSPAAETGTARALVASHVIALGVAGETDTAVAIAGKTKRLALGLATELDAARLLGGAAGGQTGSRSNRHRGQGARRVSGVG